MIYLNWNIRSCMHGTVGGRRTSRDFTTCYFPRQFSSLVLTTDSRRTFPELTAVFPYSASFALVSSYRDIRFLVKNVCNLLSLISLVSWQHKIGFLLHTPLALSDSSFFTSTSRSCPVLLHFYSEQMTWSKNNYSKHAWNMFIANDACWATLTLRRLMSYIYGAPILDVSRSHTTTQHSR